MQGLIDPVCYRDPTYFATEHHAFKHTWQFVGLMFELEDLQHVGIGIAGVSLVIQRDKQGKPRAFLNVCSHRHAQLCSEGRHRGPLRCPYHSWTYDCKGLPVGIPQSQAFPQVAANPQAHRLKEFACDTVGQFIFVRISDSGPTLQEYLGVEHEFLQQASRGMQGLYDEFQLHVEANWKVLIENSLEGYHVPAVHNKTFMKVDSMEPGHGAPIDHLNHPLHSSMTHPAQPDWLASFERRTEPKIGKWAWKFPHYTHHLIFPNLTVTSFLGYSFHVQRFEPIAVDKTRVHSRSVRVKFEGQSPVGAKLMEQIYVESKEFTDRVFQEDSSICSAVQRGLNNAIHPAVIGEGIEARVAHFHKAYHTQWSSLEQTSL